MSNIPLEEWKKEKGYILKPTTDNWCPNYNNKTVAVSPVLNISDGSFRVCVWGADDMGMERDLKTFAGAQRIKKKVWKLKVITVKKLKKLGFYPA